MNPVPVFRQVFAAALADPEADPTPYLPPTLSHPRLMTGGLYRFRSLVFLYTEWLEVPGPPQDLVPGLTPQLAPWPGPLGPSSWVPLVDVFHFNEPKDSHHWQRNQPPEQRLGRIAILKPERVASYIYYHYQLQEERAFGGGKYESIHQLGTLLFQYKELPAVIEEPAPGRLTTRGTPVPWAEAHMEDHFEPWPDGYLYFKDAACLLQS